MIRNCKIFTLLFIVTISTLGCSLLSGKPGDAEAVFAATEVGTPEGNKVTKDIGPAGGTLVSPDGRLTLTVPQNALTETIAFSMQPITNKADGGLGLAYRLEPDGKTFATPLPISARYDDKDLDGTVPEALSLAYQDKNGGWRPQDEAVLDKNARTLTFNTTHFTDWSFLSRLRISPERATVRVGQTVLLKFGPCPYRRNGMLDRLGRWMGRITVCEVTNGRQIWEIQPNWFADIGTIDQPHELTVTYTAPSRKPSPNVATVSLPYELNDQAPDSTAWTPHRGMYTAQITIIDTRYRATGRSGDVEYSGVICDLEQPFEIVGSSNLVKYPFKFAPISGTGGKVSFSARVSVINMDGGGFYTIEGAGTDNPRIAMTLQSSGHTPIGSRSGGGTVYINLVPLETDECH
ncbi:hypothetical protein BH10ACI3_BH10ACI3_28230 [soil metagenome]